MFDDIFIYIVMACIFVLAIVGINSLTEEDSIKSKSPLTPTIEIRINLDGKQDTTYVYTKP
jgi:hypothetical protein